MLTLVEREKIRNLLGYPSNFRYKNTRLESVMESDVSPELETLIRGWLEQLSNLSDQINTLTSTAITTSISSGSLKRVEDIEFYPTSSTVETSSGVSATQQTITDWERYFSGKISIALGVPFYSDAMSGGGYDGDEFSEFGGLGGRSNIIPLG